MGIAAGEVAAKVATAISPKDKAIFSYNPYFDKVVFPPSHPYGKVQEASRVMEAYGRGKTKEEIDKEKKYEVLHKFYEKPIEEQYQKIYESKAGGKVLAHELSGFSVNSMKSDGDISEVLKSAIAFAEEGYSVKIQPQLRGFFYPLYKDKIYPKLKTMDGAESNPDLYVNDSFYVDIKSLEGLSERNFKNRAKEASEQGAYVCFTDQRVAIEEDKIDYYTNTIFNSKSDKNNEFIYNRDTLYFYINGRLIPKKRT